MAYRYCRKCGWDFAPEEWDDSNFCTHCGTTLHRWTERQGSRGEATGISFGASPTNEETLRKLGWMAKEHPYLSGMGAAVVGVAAIMAAPVLVSVGTGIMWLGGVATALGTFSAVYFDQDEAGHLIVAGLLALMAGAGVMMAGCMLTGTGVFAIAAGAGIGATALTQNLLRRHLLKKMDALFKQQILPNSSPYPTQSGNNNIARP